MYDNDWCDDHGELVVRVLKSAAGWYIGTRCDECGPWDRHSQNYWPTETEAQAALDSGNFVPKF